MVFAIHQHELATGTHVSPNPEPSSHLPPHPIPLGCPRALALSALLHALNLHWSSILHMVITAASQAPLSMAFSRQEYWSGVPLPSPIYMFQCYSLKSSLPQLLLQSPKVCSLYLCLFCCLAYKVIITIFLNSIYMC